MPTDGNAEFVPSPEACRWTRARGRGRRGGEQSVDSRLDVDPADGQPKRKQSRRGTRGGRQRRSRLRRRDARRGWACGGRSRGRHQSRPRVRPDVRVDRGLRLARAVGPADLQLGGSAWPGPGFRLLIRFATRFSGRSSATFFLSTSHDLRDHQGCRETVPASARASGCSWTTSRRTTARRSCPRSLLVGGDGSLLEPSDVKVHGEGAQAIKGPRSASGSTRSATATAGTWLVPRSRRSRSSRSRARSASPPRNAEGRDGTAEGAGRAAGGARQAHADRLRGHDRRGDQGSRAGLERAPRCSRPRSSTSRHTSKRKGALAAMSVRCTNADES